MNTSVDPRIGSELAGYRIESLLGRGGMGVVYLAEDLRLKRRVALKLVAPELAADARFRERFLREAELAASLDHSHVVPVHAAGETEGQLWIAMRYVQGTDLRTVLEREGPLEPARTVDLCSQVAEALDAAHSIALVHRDVKPANVLVTEEGGNEHCYLSDFGLARSPEASDPEGGTHLSGTVDYTAPEQIAHEPLDHRADVYSLACVLYECLSGEPPFKRQRAMATLFAHSSEPPPSLHERRPDLPEPIDQVIETGLGKEPAERYATCRELCTEAREALGLTFVPKLTRRTLMVSAGGAVVLAAAAAVPAILLTRGDATTATPKPILPLTSDGVVRIDPATRLPVAAVGTGSEAGAVAVGDGAVWVLDTGTREAVRIDASSSRVTERVEPEQPGRATGVAAGAGAVWMLTVEYSVNVSGAETLWRYDSRSSSFVLVSSGRFSGLAIGLGRVWATSWNLESIDRGILHVLEPASGASEARIDGPWPHDEVFLALDEGAVWTAQRDPTTDKGHVLVRVDPASRSIMGSFPLDFPVSDLAAGQGAVWVTHPDGDAIVRIDPATGRITDEIRVGRGPERLAVGAGAVWVTSGRDGTVTRIDPATFDLETVDVGGTPNDVAVGEGAVWVAVDVR